MFGLMTAAAVMLAAQGMDDDALRAEGAANRARIKTPPAFVDGPRAELPTAEKALGHHGVAVVEGVVGADGRMRAVRVKSSSSVPALDEVALAAARGSTFTPAKDAAGAALPLTVSMPFEMVAYKSAKGGLFEYRCDQFVRDMDWWRGANAGRPWADHELYKMELGLVMLSLIQGARGDEAKLRASIAGFEAKWTRAIETCRARPGLLQKDALYK